MKLQCRETLFYLFLLFPFFLFLTIWSIVSLQRGLQRNLISKEHNRVTVCEHKQPKEKCAKVEKTSQIARQPMIFSPQSNSKATTTTLPFHQDIATLNKPHRTCWCNSALLFSIVTVNLQKTNADRQTYLNIMTVPLFQREWLVIVHHEWNLTQMDCTNSFF